RPRRFLRHAPEWPARAEGGDDGRYAAAGARPEHGGMALAARPLSARPRACGAARARLPLLAQFRRALGWRGPLPAYRPPSPARGGPGPPSCPMATVISALAPLSS